MRLPFFTPVSYAGLPDTQLRFYSHQILLQDFEKRLVPYISYVEDVLFEWTHGNISSTDSKVRNLIASEILELKRKSWVAVFLHDFSLPIFVDHELY